MLHRVDIESKSVPCPISTLWRSLYHGSKDLYTTVYKGLLLAAPCNTLGFTIANVEQSNCRDEDVVMCTAF